MPNRPVGGYAEQELLSVAARNASGAGEVFGGYGDASTLRLQLLVTNATANTSVTPTLDVVVEDTLDGGQTWNPIATFAQMTAAGRQVLNVAQPFSDRVRVRYAIGGAGASFVFGVLAASQTPAVA